MHRRFISMVISSPSRQPERLEYRLMVTSHGTNFVVPAVGPLNPEVNPARL